MDGIEDVALVSLRIRAQAEIARYVGAAALFNRGAEIRDFNDTMGSPASLERLTAVDTAVALLAGAMGASVSMALAYAPDWALAYQCAAIRAYLRHVL